MLSSFIKLKFKNDVFKIMSVYLMLQNLYTSELSTCR